MLVAAAAFYLVLSLLADWCGQRLERRAAAVRALPEPIQR
jgi:ABC-type amino acid transport system permease subunit